MKRKGEAYSGRVKNALGVAGVGLEDLADLKTDLDDAAGEESVAESSGEEASSVDSGVVSADAGSAFGAASIGIADGSTLKRSPGLNRTFGLFIYWRTTGSAFGLTINTHTITISQTHHLSIHLHLPMHYHLSRLPYARCETCPEDQDVQPSLHLSEQQRADWSS